MPGQIVGGQPNRRDWTDTLAEQLRDYARLQADKNKYKIEMAVNEAKAKQNMFFKLEEMQKQAELDKQKEAFKNDLAMGNVDKINELNRGAGDSFISRQNRPMWGTEQKEGMPSIQEVDIAMEELTDPRKLVRYEQGVDGRITVKPIDMNQAFLNTLYRIEKERGYLKPGEQAKKNELERMLSGSEQIPENIGSSANIDQSGFETVGFDQSGRPIIRKIKRNITQEKFDLERSEKEQEKKNQTNMVRESAQGTIDTIAEIKKGLKYFGAAGNVPPLPAEYEKQNWLANVDRLRDKLVVDLMLKLKSASKTGSTGFGQLSEREGQRLENAATALKKGLREEDALRYLDEIEKSARKILGDESEQETDGVFDYKSRYGLE